MIRVSARSAGPAERIAHVSTDSRRGVPPPSHPMMPLISSLERQLENMECNATSAVALTHVLLQGMLDKGLRGCLVYTSSAAAAIPSPFSVLYAGTKSFLSSFGASLASEVRPAGIDVLVFHPSPVASRFYDNAHRIDAMEFFKKMAVDPEDLPDTVFASIGRVVWRDVGPTAIAFRLLLKVSKRSGQRVSGRGGVERGEGEGKSIRVAGKESGGASVATVRIAQWGLAW